MSRTLLWRISRLPHYAWRAKCMAVQALLPKAELRSQTLGICIGFLNREPHRLANCIRTLRAQTLDPNQIDVTVVDMGSRSEITAELRSLAARYSVRLVLMNTPNARWDRSSVMNVGIRCSSDQARWILLTDADMIFAPNFAETVVRAQLAFHGAFVCGNWLMLPEGSVHADTDVMSSYGQLRQIGIPYAGGAGAGGFQCIPREWLFHAHGFDERITGWGCEDLDLFKRARLSGLETVNVERYTSLLHQWHEPAEVKARREGVEEAFEAECRANNAIFRNENSVVRNQEGWGRLGAGAELLEPPMIVSG